MSKFIGCIMIDQVTLCSQGGIDVHIGDPQKITLACSLISPNTSYKMAFDIGAPQYTFGIFSLIVGLLMTSYGRNFESNPTVLMRVVIFFILYLLVRLLDMKLHRGTGWMLSLWLMFVLSVGLKQKINYTHDETYHDTLDKMKRMRVVKEW